LVVEKIKTKNMILEPNNLYHIYNQGNNRQQIFFDKENYCFFLRKMSLHLLPYADIIAWCLMPNHFHWMLWVREDVNPGAGSKPVPGLEKKWKSLNQSIGSLQSSYTQAINKQLNRSGSLFRKHCKAENLTDIGKISSSYYNTMFGTSLRVDMSEKEYPQVCFEYIHNNPVRAGLVNHPAEWEFSSYNDYYSGRTGKLVNRELAKEFVNL